MFLEYHKDSRIAKVSTAEVQKNAATDSALNPCDARRLGQVFMMGVGFGMWKVPTCSHGPMVSHGRRTLQVLVCGYEQQHSIPQRRVIKFNTSLLQLRWLLAGSCWSSVQSMSTYMV